MLSIVIGDPAGTKHGLQVYIYIERVKSLRASSTQVPPRNDSQKRWLRRNTHHFGMSELIEIESQVTGLHAQGRRTDTRVQSGMSELIEIESQVTGLHAQVEELIQESSLEWVN